MLHFLQLSCKGIFSPKMEPTQLKSEMRNEDQRKVSSELQIKCTLKPDLLEFFHLLSFHSFSTKRVLTYLAFDIVSSGQPYTRELS